MKEKLTVKDIREMTGLTGAQIAWFHHEKVVRAAGFYTYSVNDYDGYKYYNQQDLSKFQQIAMYYELGLKRNDIRDLMKAADYDCDRALEKLHCQLQEKRDRIERHMIAIEHMQALGTQGKSLSVFGSLNLEDWGKNYQKLQTLPAWAKLQELLPHMITKSFLEELDGYIACSTAPTNETGIDDILSKIFSLTTRHLGIAGYLLIAGTAISFLGGGTFAHEMEEDLEIQLSKHQAEELWKFIEEDLNQFYHEIVDVIVRYYQFFGESFDNEQILSMVNDVRALAEFHFGLRRDVEYQLLFEMIPPSPIDNKSDYLQYIYNAVYHYHIKQQNPEDIK